MASIGNAVMYPTENDDWMKTVLIGGILSFFGFLFVPILVVSGYIIRVIRHSLDGESKPPTFGEWEELLVDGVKAFVIGFVYLLVPGLVGALTVGGSALAMATGSRSGAALGTAGFAFGMLLTLVLSLAFGYVAVAAIVNFASEGRFGAAFDFTSIKTVVFSSEYAIAWGLSIVVFFAASIVVGMLNAIPLLGTIAGAFVFFYAQVVAGHLWAGGYNDARDGSELTGRSDVGKSPV
ncbi:MAG: DUF4013 domain-containing protein [Haloarculaceae archaeon]